MRLTPHPAQSPVFGVENPENYLLPLNNLKKEPHRGCVSPGNLFDSMRVCYWKPLVFRPYRPGIRNLSSGKGQIGNVLDVHAIHVSIPTSRPCHVVQEQPWAWCVPVTHTCGHWNWDGIELFIACY